MKIIAKHIFKILKYCIITIIAFLIFTSISNIAITAIEKNKNHAPENIVINKNSNIHLLIRGSGNTKIILLSGLGTASPHLDFMPLIEELEKNYIVCVVELNGYGWSKTTKTPRTNENIVNEIRLSLQEANIYPPYVLMPHSIAGIYSLYYANNFPQEIKAIIGLDTSVAIQAKNIKNETRINWYGILRNIGLVRLALFIKPDYLGYDKNTYKTETIKKINMFTCWNLYNENIWDEDIKFANNCEEVSSYVIPKNIPCRFILSNETINHSIRRMGINWLAEHEKLIGSNNNGAIITLDGSHHIHRKNYLEITKIVNELFL